GDEHRLPDVREDRPQLALLDDEGDTRDEDAVEEALEDRRVAVVPHRVDEDDRLGRAQPVDIRLYRRRQILRHLVVEQPLLAAHHRLEAFLVEVERVDLVAIRSEGLERGIVEAAAEAGLHGMRVDDEDPHQAAPSVCSPANSQTRPDSKSKSGSSQAIILPGLSKPLGSASFLNASCPLSVRFMPPSSSV